MYFIYLCDLFITTFYVTNTKADPVHEQTMDLTL